MKSQPIHYSRISLALAALLITAFTALPLRAAIAAPPAQDAPDAPAALFLGEYVVEEMVNGETRDYQLTVPEDAIYETTVVDEDEAIAFDLVVTDDDGNEIFNDIFGNIELELNAGDVFLHFEAVDNAVL